MQQEQQPAQSNEQNKQLELGAFRQEIEAIAQQEERTGETAHFQDGQSKKPVKFNACELNEADMEMWRKVKLGTFTLEEYHAYSKMLPQPSVSPTRHAFLSLIGNNATVAILKKELDQSKQP